MNARSSSSTRGEIPVPAASHVGDGSSVQARSVNVHAFTLLELLVAVTITLVITGLMLAVTASVFALWGRAQGTHTQVASARQVFALISRDLESAINRHDGNRWMACDILDAVEALPNHGWLAGPGLMKPSGGAGFLPLPPPDSNGFTRIHDARFGLSGVWLRLVATNLESGGSLPTLVAWQVVRRPVTGNPVSGNPAPVRYSLYRSAVSDGETFARGYDVTASAYSSTNNTPSSALSTTYRLPRNVTNPSHANLLASNVVDFGCWLHVRDGAGALVRIFPADALDGSHHAVGGSLMSDSRFPHVVDVMVRILSEEGAVLIEAMEAGLVTRPPEYETDSIWWWSVVMRHSMVFTQRIEIKGGVR